MTATSDDDQDRPALWSGPGLAEASTTVEVWVTVLEFAAAEPGRLFEVEQVDNLIEHLRTLDASGLWSPDRYVVQMNVPAERPDQALERAMAYHRDANAAAGLPPTKVVRVEVLTIEELERSWQECRPTGPTSTSATPTALVCKELYTATRGLHAAATVGELTDILTRFVTAIGGRVEAGPPRHIPGTIEIDLSLEGDHPRHATAEAFSVAGLVLEQSLPTLVTDTREAFGRLRTPHLHSTDRDV